MIEQPAVVDENGDIILHGRQGAEIVIEFQNSDGSARSMVGATVTFECGETINVPLTAVAGEAAQMKLTLTNLIVKDIFNAENKDFVILETAPAALPTPHWVGRVYVNGWIE